MRGINFFAESGVGKIVEGVAIGVLIILITGLSGAFWNMHSVQITTVSNVQVLENRVEKLEGVSDDVRNIQKDMALIQQSQKFQNEKIDETNQKLDLLIEIMEKRRGE